VKREAVARETAFADVVGVSKSPPGDLTRPTPEMAARLCSKAGGA